MGALHPIDTSTNGSHPHRTLKSWEPATGELLGEVPVASRDDVLETIARAYGKPKMDRALGVYTRRFRFKHPTPDDLIATIRDEIGPGAAENLRAGLFDKGWVDYTITQMSSHPSRAPAGMFDRGGKRETISPDKTTTPNRYDGWVLVVRRGTLRFPVEIDLVATDGSRTRVKWDGEQESYRIPYSGSAALRSAIVDPDDNILIDDHPTNNFAVVPGHPIDGAPRTLERGMFWAATLLGGLAP